MNINDTLAERGSRYGEFRDHAEISQRLKTIVAAQGNLSHVQREAIEMICHKLARIANGDPNYVDSWQDIAGYATLVVRELERDHAED